MSHRLVVFFFALLLVLGVSSSAFAQSGKPHVKKPLKKLKDKKHHHNHHHRPR